MRGSGMQKKWGELPSVKLALETKLRCVGSKGEQRRKKGRGALIRQRERGREGESLGVR